MTTEPLADQAARNRITTDTAATLFVEAGAGSGKTHSLVGRICQLVLPATQTRTVIPSQACAINYQISFKPNANVTSLRSTSAIVF